MEDYKAKLKVQNLIIALGCFILMVFCFLSVLSEAGVIPFFKPFVSDSQWQSMWRGFVMGAACGILALLIIALIRNIRALLNEKYLRKLYVKEKDERSKQICTCARSAAMQVFLLGGLVAAVVSGYFSVTVSVTILCCVFASALLAGAFKLYYSRKF